MKNVKNGYKNNMLKTTTEFVCVSYSIILYNLVFAFKVRTKHGFLLWQADLERYSHSHVSQQATTESLTVNETQDS